MTRTARRVRTNAAPLFIVAASAYAANCALGVAVATRLIDTRDFRWVHHALYIATCVTTGVAIVLGWWGRPRGASRSAALLLAPAAVPLAIIPRVRTHSRRHPLTALTAAPFLLASLIRSLRPSDRK
jgi:hypothetical protein